MNWDEYFYEICNTISKNSKCLSRKIGAVLVRDNSIISTGYNGSPRSVFHCNVRYRNDEILIEELKKENKYDDYYEKYRDQCPRRVLGYKSGEGLEICIAGHGERNCIINAARLGIPVKDSILYCNCPIPCTPCLIEIINAGIKEIVVTDMSSYDKMGKWLIKHSGIGVRLFDIENLKGGY